MGVNSIIPHNKVSKYTLYGNDAIKAVEKIEGKLSQAQRRVVELEGYVPHKYYDSKGVVTFGVGQTGEFIKKGFKQSFKDHENRTKRRIKDFDSLPDSVKKELIQGEYRGDLGLSPTAIRLFNEGKYNASSKEMLNNEEYKRYKNSGSGGNIPERMEALSMAIGSLSHKSKEDNPETMFSKYTPTRKPKIPVPERKPSTIFTDNEDRNIVNG